MHAHKILEGRVMRKWRKHAREAKTVFRLERSCGQDVSTLLMGFSSPKDLVSMSFSKITCILSHFFLGPHRHGRDFYRQETGKESVFTTCLLHLKHLINEILANLNGRKRKDTVM